MCLIATEQTERRQCSVVVVVVVIVVVLLGAAVAHPYSYTLLPGSSRSSARLIEDAESASSLIGVAGLTC